MSLHDTILEKPAPSGWDGHINEAGLGIIKTFEGWSASVYRCPAGRYTVGWGSTWDHRGRPITADQADISEKYVTTLLRRELRHVESAVRRLITAELNENMFSAIASWAYNCGTSAMHKSTLRMKLNREDYEGAANELPKWRRAGGRVLLGLVRRRKVEQALFLKEV